MKKTIIILSPVRAEAYFQQLCLPYLDGVIRGSTFFSLCSIFFCPFRAIFTFDFIRSALHYAIAKALSEQKVSNTLFFAYMLDFLSLFYGNSSCDIIIRSVLHYAIAFLGFQPVLKVSQTHECKSALSLH